jgi:DNA-binding MarR family transcriptional regulator
MEIMAQQKPRMTQQNYETLANFRYALRRFMRFSEEAAMGAGLTPQQYQGLLAIKGFPGDNPITIGELAERLQLRAHSAVALVDRLVQHEFASRQASVEDKRQVYVILTAPGEAILEQLAWVHREELRSLEPSLMTILGTLRGE